MPVSFGGEFTFRPGSHTMLPGYAATELSPWRVIEVFVGSTSSSSALEMPLVSLS